jgi:hypothetical protein
MHTSFSALIRKSWLIQKKFADLRYERKGFIALLAPAYMRLNGRRHKGYRPMLYAAIGALGSLPSPACRQAGLPYPP